MANELSVVGKRLPRWNANAIVTGAVKYTVDIKFPRILSKIEVLLRSYLYTFQLVIYLVWSDIYKLGRDYHREICFQNPPSKKASRA